MSNTLEFRVVVSGAAAAAREIDAVTAAARQAAQAQIGLAGGGHMMPGAAGAGYAPTVQLPVAAQVDMAAVRAQAAWSGQVYGAQRDATAAAAAATHANRQLAAALVSVAGAGGPAASVIFQMARAAEGGAGAIGMLKSAVNALPTAALAVAVTALVNNLRSLYQAIEEGRDIQVKSGAGRQSWFGWGMDAIAGAEEYKYLAPGLYFGARALGYGAGGYGGTLGAPGGGLNTAPQYAAAARAGYQQWVEGQTPEGIVLGRAAADPSYYGDWGRIQREIERERWNQRTPEQIAAEVDDQLGAFFGGPIGIDATAAGAARERVEATERLARAAEAEISAKERILELTGRTDEAQALRLERELRQLQKLGVSDDVLDQLRRAGLASIVNGADRDLPRFAGSLARGTREEFTARIGTWAVGDSARDTAKNTADTVAGVARLEAAIRQLLGQGAQVVLIGEQGGA